jgi:hypothetical protein
MLFSVLSPDQSKATPGYFTDPVQCGCAAAVHKDNYEEVTNLSLLSLKK